jgi:hypothetical protein
MCNIENCTTHELFGGGEVDIGLEEDTCVQQNEIVIMIEYDRAEGKYNQMKRGENVQRAERCHGGPATLTFDIYHQPST